MIVILVGQFFSYMILCPDFLVSLNGVFRHGWDVPLGFHAPKKTFLDFRGGNWTGAEASGTPTAPGPPPGYIRRW